MSRVDIYDLPFPEPSRWIPGDQYVRPWLRRLATPFRGRGAGGLAKVTKNLELGFQRLGVDYRLHRRVSSPRPASQVGLLHGPIADCRRLASNHACVVGPGVLNAALEWPDLFSTTKAKTILQNCEWAADMYRPTYNGHVKVWTMGVDEVECAPRGDTKTHDFLVYDKIRWPETPAIPGLVEHCLSTLTARGLSFQYIRYGKYPRGRENAFHEMLRTSRALLFLCECETQGFAYNEALSFDVPMLAWDLGHWWDPARFSYGLTHVPATSVPYFDERCGLTFRGTDDFEEQLGVFLERLRAQHFRPRDYVLEHLTLTQAAERYLSFLQDT